MPTRISNLPFFFGGASVVVTVLDGLAVAMLMSRK
jgi:hypothetical protein